jgi:hypothetical protein
MLEEEEHADDEGEDEDEDEDGPQIVNEPPSLESLQPYPRDVSTEPSPDPTRQGFVPTAPDPVLVQGVFACPRLFRSLPDWGVSRCPWDGARTTSPEK